MERVLLGLWVLTLAAEVSQGMPSNSISCCTQVAKRIPQNMLPLVTRVQVQPKDGICNIRAVILHIFNNKKCMDPNNKSLQKWIKKFCRQKNSCSTL